MKLEQERSRELEQGRCTSRRTSIPGWLPRFHPTQISAGRRAPSRRQFSPSQPAQSQAGLLSGQLRRILRVGVAHGNFASPVAYHGTCARQREHDSDLTDLTHATGGGDACPDGCLLAGGAPHGTRYPLHSDVADLAATIRQLGRELGGLPRWAREVRCWTGQFVVSVTRSHRGSRPASVGAGLRGRLQHRRSGGSRFGGGRGTAVAGIADLAQPEVLRGIVGTGGRTAPGLHRHRQRVPGGREARSRPR